MSKISNNFPLKDYLKCKDSEKAGFGTCIACSKLVAWSRSKIISHKVSRNCAGISDADVTLFRSLKTVQSVEVRTITVENIPDRPESSSGSSSTNDNILSRTVDRLSLAEKQKCDDAVASFFLRTSIPLSIADSEPFKNLINVLRPAYGKHVPSSKVIGGRLLDEEYEQIKKSNLEKIRKAKSYSIVTDGWTNLRNEHILNFIIVIPSSKPIFFKVSSLTK